jgi:predicted RNase H-like HicB family nuclease
MSQVAELGKSLEEATENLNRLLGVLEDAHSSA